MDNLVEIKTILDYISLHPADNSNLFTLWHEIGHEAFLQVVREADGRRVILYHLPEDTDKCDPPIYWRYGADRRRH